MTRIENIKMVNIAKPNKKPQLGQLYNYAICDTMIDVLFMCERFVRWSGG